MKPQPRGQADERDWLHADVTHRLFTRRHVLLYGPLDIQSATRLAAELMTLEAEGLEPITLSVNSTGGDLVALWTAVDVMAAMHAPVHTRCLGQACGTAVALVAAGSGYRQATPNARFLLRLPETEVSGPAADIVQAADNQTTLTARLFDLLSRATQRPRVEIAHDWHHTRGLSAPEALAEGLIDEIV